MKVTGAIGSAFGVAVTVEFTSVATVGGRLPSIRRDVFRRVAEEDVPIAGVVDLHPIASDQQQVEEELVAALEADGHTTG